jgi:formate dehydrogenase major subunit
MEPNAGRMCIVEVQGLRGLPAASTTPAAEGMTVATESELIRRARCARTGAS